MPHIISLPNNASHVTKKSHELFGNKIKDFYLCIGFIIVMNTTLKRKEDDETIRSIIRA